MFLSKATYKSERNIMVYWQYHGLLKNLGAPWYTMGYHSILNTCEFGFVFAAELNRMNVLML